jgi:hypothetical protein
MPASSAAFVSASTCSANSCSTSAFVASSRLNAGAIVSSSTGRNKLGPLTRGADGVGRRHAVPSAARRKFARPRSRSIGPRTTECAQHVLAGRQLMDRHDAREDHARVAGRPYGGTSTLSSAGAFGSVAISYSIVRPSTARAVRFDVSVDRAERHVVADCRPEQFDQLRSGRRPSARSRSGWPALVERGVNRVLDGADAITFGDRQLERVVARRTLAPVVYSQRRGHAVERRRRAHDLRLRIDLPAVLVGNQ